LKILVCMKQVPQKDAPLKLNETAAWIREDVSYEVNEPDAFALEEALRHLETELADARQRLAEARRQSYRAESRQQRAAQKLSRLRE